VTLPAVLQDGAIVQRFTVATTNHSRFDSFRVARTDSELILERYDSVKKRVMDDR